MTARLVLPTPGLLRRPFHPRLRATLREVWHLVRGFAGEQAYERYLAHHTAHHPGVEPLPEREFWRRHTDRGDTHPAARCC